MAGLIGLPNTGVVLTEFMLTMLHLDYCGCNIGQLRASALHLAREYIGEQCINEGYDYVMFIDTDMDFPPILIKQLLMRDKPIISAMCFKKTRPYSPAFFEKCRLAENNRLEASIYNLNTIPNDIFEVEAVGMAATLIRREVFEKVPRPWFAPFDYAGEDVSFCVRARKSGFPIYVDPSMVIRHIGAEPIDVFSYLEEKQKIEDLQEGKV